MVTLVLAVAAIATAAFSLNSAQQASKHPAPSLWPCLAAVSVVVVGVAAAAAVTMALPWCGSL